MAENNPNDYGPPSKDVDWDKLRDSHVRQRESNTVAKHNDILKRLDNSTEDRGGRRPRNDQRGK